MTTDPLCRDLRRGDLCFGTEIANVYTIISSVTEHDIVHIEALMIAVDGTISLETFYFKPNWRTSGIWRVVRS